MASNVVGNLIVKLAADIASYESSMRKASKVAEREMGKLQKTIHGVERRLNNFANVAMTAFAVLGAGAVVKNIANAAIQMERIDNALRVATGSSEAAANEFKFVRMEAQRLGLDLASSATAYARLSAASRGTALQGQETRDIFVAVSEAATVLSLSAEQTQGALTAIEQMISKGTVSAEELRGQLGEELPGAFQIAARSMGVTTEELDKLLRTGKVSAEQMLPLLAAELRRTFGPEVEKAANGTQQAINRMNTAIFEFKNQLAQGGVLDAFTASVGFIGAAVSNLRPTIIAMIGAFDAGLERMRYAFEFTGIFVAGKLREAFRVIGNAFADLMESMRIGFISIQRTAALVGIGLAGIPGFGGISHTLIDFGTSGIDTSIENLRTLGGTAGDTAVKLADAARAHRENIDAIRDNTTALFAESKGMGQTIGPAIEESSRVAAAAVEETAAAVEESAGVADKAFDFMAEAAKRAARSIHSALADFLFDPFEDGLDGMLKGFLDVIRRMVAEMAAFKLLSSFGGTALGAFFGAAGFGPAPGHAAIGGAQSGPTIVGEHGPELVNLPAMSKVTPTSKMGGDTVQVSIQVSADADMSKTDQLAARLRRELEMMLNRRERGLAHG